MRGRLKKNFRPVDGVWRGLLEPDDDEQRVLPGRRGGVAREPGAPGQQTGHVGRRNRRSGAAPRGV